MRVPSTRIQALLSAIGMRRGRCYHENRSPGDSDYPNLDNKPVCIIRGNLTEQDAGGLATPSQHGLTAKDRAEASHEAHAWHHVETPSNEPPGPYVRSQQKIRRGEPGASKRTVLKHRAYGRRLFWAMQHVADSRSYLQCLSHLRPAILLFLAPTCYVTDLRQLCSSMAGGRLFQVSSQAGVLLYASPRSLSTPRNSSDALLLWPPFVFTHTIRL